MVTSHHLWRALGESPRIVGRQVILNGSPATVIGVMPAAFTFPSAQVDAWVPLSLSAKNRSNREGRWLAVIGRTRSDITQREVTSEMEPISRRLATFYPATNAGWSATVVPLKDEVVGKTRPILLVLQAGTLILLLITCTSLANLFVARGMSRSREMALRAVLGGAAGILLGMEGVRLVRVFGEGLIPRAAEIQVSLPVAAFTAAVTLATALTFGLFPAMQLSRFNVREQLVTRAHDTSQTAARQRGILISIEVGLACILLVGAGLLGAKAWFVCCQRLPDCEPITSLRLGSAKE